MCHPLSHRSHRTIFSSWCPPLHFSQTMVKMFSGTLMPAPWPTGAASCGRAKHADAKVSQRAHGRARAPRAPLFGWGPTQPRKPARPASPAVQRDRAPWMGARPAPLAAFRGRCRAQRPPRALPQTQFRGGPARRTFPAARRLFLAGSLASTAGARPSIASRISAASSSSMGSTSGSDTSGLLSDSSASATAAAAGEGGMPSEAAPAAGRRRGPGAAARAAEKKTGPLSTQAAIPGGPPLTQQPGAPIPAGLEVILVGQQQLLVVLAQRVGHASTLVIELHAGEGGLGWAREQRRTGCAAAAAAMSAAPLPAPSPAGRWPRPSNPSPR